jgi:hypothetical protein
VKIGMNREFVRDWKGSTCGLFQSAVVVYTGKLRENFMLVRSLPEVVKFVGCAQVNYEST